MDITPPHVTMLTL